MLKPEDCLPGTPVICIKYEGVLSPPNATLEIGGEYSIKDFYPKGSIVTSGLFEGLGMPEHSISLNEIAQNDGDDWCYMIEWFKLKYDPQALKIFEFKGINQSLKKETKKEREDA